jgi:chaperonin GroES
MNIRPIHDNVVIALEERNRVSQGGIYMPDTAKEVVMRARVLRVGPGTRDWPVTVKPGDVVLVGEKRRPGSEVGEPVVAGDDANAERLGLSPGQEVRIVRENEIVAVLESCQEKD